MAQFPVYVVNLATRADRMERMSSLLSGLGVQFERVDAVNGRQLTQEGINAIEVEAGDSIYLSGAELGCFLSHRECWQRLLLSNAPAAIILEDDVIFANDAAVLLRSTEWLPNDADFVRLEACFMEVELDPVAQAYSGRFGAFRMRSNQYGTGGYLITRDSAKRALRATRGLSRPIDLMLFDVDASPGRLFVHYQLSPAVCAQGVHLEEKSREFVSDIREGSVVRARRKRRPAIPLLILREVRRSIRKAARKLAILTRKRRRIVVEFS